jgi:fructose-1,6-bisphosphatase I
MPYFFLQKDFPYAKGELSSLLHNIGTAAKRINKKISKASDGNQSILEITPSSLHQRSPFYAGSKNMVMKVEEFLDLNR